MTFTLKVGLLAMLTFGKNSDVGTGMGFGREWHGGREVELEVGDLVFESRQVNARHLFIKIKSFF